MTNEQGETHQVMVTFTESGQLLFDWEFGVAATKTLVEEGIQHHFAEKYQQTAPTVTCPEGTDFKTSRDIDCDVAFPGDEQISVHVTIDAQERAFSYRTTTPLTIVDQVEKQIIASAQGDAPSFANASLAKLIGSEPTAKCNTESPVIATSPGRELPCVVTNEQGETYQVVVTFTEPGQAIFDWEFDAAMMRDVDSEKLAQDMMREMGFRDPEALAKALLATDDSLRDDSQAAISMAEIDALVREAAKEKGLTAEQLQALEPMKPKLHALLNALQQQANAQ